jgi:hypothetical protein
MQAAWSHLQCPPKASLIANFQDPIELAQTQLVGTRIGLGPFPRQTKGVSERLLIRDAAEWAQSHLPALQAELNRIDAKNVHHIDTCPGCPECDDLMNFYSGCEVCGRTAHKEAMVHDPETGTFTCPDCLHKQQEQLKAA